MSPRAEGLRHSKSTAAGEGGRATRNQAISVGLNGGAKAAYKVKIQKRGWNPTLQKTKSGRAALAQNQNTPTPYSFGIDSTAPRVPEGEGKPCRTREPGVTIQQTLTR